MLQLPIYEEFARWLDDLLENNDMPEETKAFCFNLYEESDEDHIYGAQLIAAGEFDPDDKDGDWACEEVWSSEENIFTVDTSDEDDTGWSHALELFKEMVEEYLKNGKYSEIIKGAKGVAIGFVDGELELLS
ncbi:MAG: hypothetical protein K5898_16085 [Ruminococcus sp.]|uniref:hypothetical protein n=1 Tax=Ruminococcus sp. TaxID=41978 RepID=UPI0025E8BD56|nr:hypothetical protein [Ruminococcus sp.]MCR4796659.1 hypothetical protein [Ruminococcus sp.]